MTKSVKGKGSISMENKAGTSDLSCACESWLDHWKTFANVTTTPECHVEGCTEYAEVGAHVILTNVSNEALKNLTYIAPMCKSHNGTKGKLKSKFDMLFINADKLLTCGEKK